MRLAIKTLVALAAAILATSTEAAKAVQTGGDVHVVQSSHILPGENKRLLRSEHDEGKLLEDDEGEDDEEERNRLHLDCQNSTDGARIDSFSEQNFAGIESDLSF
eukprot:jgi/Phyca11/14087/fgenesh1_pg.PHYCAscaffold_6_\